jgi:hypothetical protein
MSRRTRVAMLAGGVAGGAAAGAAAAHLVNTDLGPFYGGLVPPLTAARAGRGCLVSPIRDRRGRDFEP